MKTFFSHWVTIFVSALIWCGTVYGAPAALLIGGAAGDESGRIRLQMELDLFGTCVTNAGVAPEAIRRFDDSDIYDAATLDQALTEIAAQVASGEIDALWIGIFGHAQQGRREVLLKLPRGVFPAPRLAVALDALEVPQRIFCFNTLSCEVAELLATAKHPDRFIVAATNRTGKRNPPGIPGFFLRLWRDGGATDFVGLAREATLAAQRSAAEREVFFDEQPMLVARGQRADFPFAEVAIADLPPLAAGGGAKTAATVTKPEATGQESGFDAHIEQRQLAFSLNADGALHIEERCDIVIDTATGAERLTVIQLPPPNGASACEIIEATHIRPDGSAGMVTARNDWMQLRFPGLEPGSRIVYAYSWDEAMSGAAKSAAFLSREFALAREYPQSRVEFSFSLPKKFPVAWRIYGLDTVPTPAVEETPYNRIYRFELAAIPAAERLPDLPPEQLAGVRAVFSLVPDWTSFAAQYLALLDGSGRLNAEGAELARTLTAQATGTAEKLERLYDFANALRYDTTPYGVRALRPRQPEAVLATGTADCKDKANLLVAFARELGIKGYLALLRRGGAADTDFPSWQFNHAVAYFPEVEGFPDGLWLDATDTETPFGTLPPGDAGHPALVLEAGKAHFLTMAPGLEAENLAVREWRFSERPDGSVEGERREENGGIFAYQARHSWKNQSPKQRLFAWQNQLAREWRDAELTGVTAAAGERGTLGIAAAFTAPGVEAVELPEEWTVPFGLAEREAAMLLHDGQSYRLVQRIIYNGGAADAELEMDEKWDSPHYAARLMRRGTETAWELELTVTCRGGLIEMADYPADRTLWREIAHHYRAEQK